MQIIHKRPVSCMLNLLGSSNIWEKNDGIHLDDKNKIVCSYVFIFKLRCYQFSDVLSHSIILKLRKIYTIIYPTDRILYFPLTKGQEILSFAATVGVGKFKFLQHPIEG